MRRLGDGEAVAPDAYYMRTVARLETGHPDYAWINRMMFIGTGAREDQTSASISIASSDPPAAARRMRTAASGGLRLAGVVRLSKLLHYNNWNAGGKLASTSCHHCRRRHRRACRRRLTLDQIGVPFTVFEAVRELRPLGVGINIQPNAVRELYDLGIGADDLDVSACRRRNGRWSGSTATTSIPSRAGCLAGYNWPQYAVHRGLFHMLLLDRLRERAGADAVRLAARR